MNLAPHRIKICIVKTGNRAIFPQIEQQAGPNPAHGDGAGLTLMAEYHRAQAERARAEEAERSTPEGLARAARHLSSTFSQLVGESVRHDPSITTAGAVRLMLEELGRMSPSRRQRIERELQVTALASLAERLLTSRRSEKGA